ncbi:MAG: sodium/glutamate symporter [Pilosibacter sp.]
MITLQLDMYQACALGALVYCLGRLMVNKLSFLSKYCIPAPVAGGIVFAFAHLALYAAGILELSFDTTLQSVFMTVFFCSVGFTACFRLLKKGGLQVFLFLGLAVAICVIQDAVGSGLTQQPLVWIRCSACMGSMPLVERTRNIRFLRTAS